MAGIQHGYLSAENLLHRVDLVSAGSQLGGQGDLITSRQRMDFAKVVIYTSVMACDCHIAIPDAGVFKMPCAGGQSGGIRSLINLDIQPNGRDGQGGQMAPAVIEGIRNRRIGRHAAAGVHAGQGGRSRGVGDGGCAAAR